MAKTTITSKLFAELLKNYNKICARNTSLKIHFLYSHLDFFPDTWVQQVMSKTNVSGCDDNWETSRILGKHARRLLLDNNMRNRSKVI